LYQYIIGIVKFKNHVVVTLGTTKG